MQTKIKEGIYFKSLIFKNRGKIIFCSFLGFLCSVFIVSFAFTSKFLLDEAFVSTPNFLGSKLMWLIITLILLVIGEIVSYFFYNYFANKFINDLEKAERHSFFSKSLTIDYNEFLDKPNASYLTLLSKDISSISEGVFTVIPSFVSYVTRIGISIIMLFVLDYIFASIFLAVGVIIFILSKLLRKKNKEFNTYLMAEEEKVLGFYNESLVNTDILRIFNNYPAVYKKEEQINSSYVLSKNKKYNFNIVINTLFSFLLRISFVLAIGYFSLNFNPSFTAGSMLGSVQLISNIEGPFSSLSGLFSKYYSLISNSTRIEEIFNKKTQIKEPLKEEFKNIEIKDVSFCYKQNENVLNNINLEILPKEFIVIEGISGAGKSTFIKLLLGLLKPTSGTLTVNNKLETYDVSNLFAYVPQNNFIIFGTLEDNLRYFNDSISKEKMIDVLSHVGLDKYANKLDTKLSNLSDGMSIGEIQRIGIARAILLDSEILVLDEASSSLDVANEEKILTYLKSLKRTIIFISHRSVVKSFATKVIKFNKGSVKVELL
ncbi:MAG: ABC transporter ATP-binding protein [Bacilli bacterium]